MNIREKVLIAKKIHKEYPGVVALDNVSIDFIKGEVHSIVGENGAGKSTLMKILSGSIIPNGGEIFYRDQTYRSFNPKQALQLGISTIYQELNLVKYISVAENIFLGEKIGKGLFFNKNRVIEKASELIKSLEIDLDPNEIVRNISPSKQQMIEILLAVSRKVKILIMDEPSAMLSQKEFEMMLEVVKKLKNQGVTIIYISHKIEEIYLIADRVTVLRDGKLIKTSLINEINKKELINLMVGRDIRKMFVHKNYKKDGICLEVKKLNKENVLKDVSFTLGKGEILGIGGLVGAGRTDLLRCIIGADKKDSGKIFINGKERIIKSPSEAIKHGVVLIPEDRKEQGLILNMSVGDNITLSILNKISKLTFIKNKIKLKIIQKYIEVLELKLSSINEKVLNLSGGNQQKVVISKMLATKSEIILFDEPTRGIDVGAKQELYKLINQLAMEGKSILIVSSDMVELLGISDRIIVMRNGEISGELNRQEFSESNLFELATESQ